MQARSLEKEATARAIVDQQGVGSLLKQGDLKIWEFDPLPFEPGSDPVKPCASVEHLQSMRLVAQALQAELGPASVTQVRLIRSRIGCESLPVCVCGYRAREHCRGMVSAVDHGAIATQP